MKRNFWLAALPTAALVLALTALAAPALAQVGGVTGKVVDEQGNPVADAEVVVNNPDNPAGMKMKTNAKGEYSAIGIMPADYQIKATKGNMTGQVDRFHIGLGGPTAVPTITVKAAGGAGAAAAVSAEEAERINKERAEMLAKFQAAQAMVDAGNYDAAVAEFQAVAEKTPNCALCYVNIGDALVKKKDEAGAEAAFKKAIEFDPNNSAPYSALAGIYNAQKKFDLANQMSAKATELMSASGSTDPVAFVNQGIILWNQNKFPEAKAQFQKATELDAKNADAHYWFGMALLNVDGNVAEAAKHMKEYLALAPTGQYAETAKQLSEMK